MEFRKGPGRIYYHDDAGKLLAEVVFSEKDGVAVFSHTFVDDSLRGQGVAGQLMAAAVEQVQAAGGKVRLVCSYAVAWFAKHPEFAELVEESGQM